MPQPLTIELRGSATATADGAGAAVDIGATRTAVRVTIVASAGPPQSPFRVGIQTSPDGLNGWMDIDELWSIDRLGAQEFSVDGAQRFIRARWEVYGAEPVEFAVLGVAHQVYCSSKDIGRYGIREAALVDITTPSSRADACIAASSEADGYLGARYTLPLTAWGDDLRAHCARMAARYALDACGWQPDGPDDVVERAFDRALAWFKQLRSDQLDPPDIVDSSPITHPRKRRARIVSRPRGWSSTED